MTTDAPARSSNGEAHELELEPGDLDHPNLASLPGPWKRFVLAVRRARDRKGLSQSQVAEVIKVHLDVIRRLETGRAEPGVVLFADLVRYLDIDPMNVVFGQRASKLQDLSVVEE